MKGPVILGNGLSALIWAVYHPNSILIGPGRPGGIAKDMKAPFFLHKHPATEKLLKKLGLSTETREVKIGYAYITSNGTYILGNPPTGFRESYYLHSRCLPDSGLPIPGSVMNKNIGNFEAFTTSSSELINSLIEAVISTRSILYNDTIRKIIPSCSAGVCSTEICGNRINEMCDNVVSTLPVMIFYRLINRSPPVIPSDSLTKIFLKGGKQSSEIMKYNFIYLSPHPKNSSTYLSSSNITRINNNQITGETFFEYTFMSGDPAIDRIMKDLIKIYGEDRVSIYPNISVRIGRELKGYYGIKFLGRGACWDHSIKVQDVVMEAQNHATK